MKKDFDKIMENPAFKSFNEERRRLITEFQKEVSGKSAKEVLPLVGTFFDKFNKAGSPLTKEEKTLMLAVLINEMDEDEKNKMERIIGLMGGLRF